MNRMLANILGFLNGLIALVIILVGVASGVQEYLTSNSVVWLAGGPLIGVLAATVFCGLIAIFIDIRNTLREILQREAQRASERS